MMIQARNCKIIQLEELNNAAAIMKHIVKAMDGLLIKEIKMLDEKEPI